MAKLRLKDWAHIAEVVGGVAVILSLLFVGFQVRANTNEVRAANRQQLVGRAHAAVRGFAADPQLANIIARAGAGDSLSAAERVQYGYVLRAVLYDVQEAFVLHGEGRLDDEFWLTRSALVNAYLSNPVALDLYTRDRAQGTMLGEFTGWVDSMIVESR